MKTAGNKLLHKFGLVKTFTTFSVSQQLGGPEQTAEFKVKESHIIWKINKMEGKGEEASHFKVCVFNQ